VSIPVCGLSITFKSADDIPLGLVGGEKACNLITFTGLVDTNESCLVFGPANLEVPKGKHFMTTPSLGQRDRCQLMVITRTDLCQGRITYSPWVYVKKAHVDQLAKDAVSCPQPPQQTIKWHAKHYFKPLKKGVKFQDFRKPFAKKHNEESKPTSTVDLNQLDLLDLADLKQTYLEGLGQILASTVQEALGKNKLFGTCT
jgi:hypothetical protein